MAALPGLQEAAINIVAAGAGDNTVITAVAGKNILVAKLILSSSAAISIIFKDGATALTGPMALAIGVPLPLEESYAGIPWFTATGNFVINVSGAATVGGRVIYYQE